MTPADLKWTDRDEESLRAFIDFQRHVTEALAQVTATPWDNPARVRVEEWGVLFVPDQKARKRTVSVNDLGRLLLLFLLIDVLVCGGLSALVYLLGGWQAVGIAWASIVGLTITAYFWNGGR